MVFRLSGRMPAGGPVREFPESARAGAERRRRYVFFDKGGKILLPQELISMKRWMLFEVPNSSRMSDDSICVSPVGTPRI